MKTSLLCQAVAIAVLWTGVQAGTAQAAPTKGKTARTSTTRRVNGANTTGVVKTTPRATPVTQTPGTNNYWRHRHHRHHRHHRFYGMNGTGNGFGSGTSANIARTPHVHHHHTSGTRTAMHHATHRSGSGGHHHSASHHHGGHRR